MRRRCVGRSGNGSGAGTMAWKPEGRLDTTGNLLIRRAVVRPTSAPWSRRPELAGLDAIALHLEMQGLVIPPKESSRLTLVPSSGVQGHVDRLSLRLGRRPVADLLQGEAGCVSLFSSLAVRSYHRFRRHGSVSPPVETQSSQLGNP